MCSNSSSSNLILKIESSSQPLTPESDGDFYDLRKTNQLTHLIQQLLATDLEMLPTEGFKDKD